MKKVSDIVADFVADKCAPHVFMLPGGACMHLVDSIGKHSDLTAIGCLHEQGAAIAAEAYSQVRKPIGVALVTAGPGSTNAVTGVAAAWIDSTPLMMISGQAKTTELIKDFGVRQMGVQEVDICSIVRPITKRAIQVTDPEQILAALEEALWAATSGRPGPVWLDIPLDVQGARVDENALVHFTPPSEPPRDISSEVQRVADLIAKGERVAILAGNGISLSGAEQEFEQLVDRLGFPVLTTWRSLNLMSDDHPLYFGRPGAVASRTANFIQQNADLLLIIGTRLDLPQVGFDHARFGRSAKKVLVDIDPREIAKLSKMPIEVAVQADAKEFISALLEELEDIELDSLDPWLAQCRAWREAFPLITPGMRKPGPVNPYVLVDMLSDALSPEDLIVPGSSGACSEVALQAYRLKKGQRLVNSPGLGAMGFGLPATIGACLASGKRRVISIDGDGGFQMNAQELGLIAGLKLPIKIFVLNNNGYGSIRFTHNRHFEGRIVCCDESSGLFLPEIKAVVEAYGVPCRIVPDQQTLEAELDDILSSDGPVVVDLHIDPEVVTSPRLSSMVKEDGSIVSQPMENLWPFLDREEFAAQMLVPLVDD